MRELPFSHVRATVGALPSMCFSTARSFRLAAVDLVPSVAIIGKDGRFEGKERKFKGFGSCGKDDEEF